MRSHLDERKLSKTSANSGQNGVGRQIIWTIWTISLCFGHFPTYFTLKVPALSIQPPTTALSVDQSEAREILNTTNREPTHNHVIFLKEPIGSSAEVKVISNAIPKFDVASKDKADHSVPAVLEKSRGIVLTDANLELSPDEGAAANNGSNYHVTSYNVTSGLSTKMADLDQFNSSTSTAQFLTTNSPGVVQVCPQIEHVKGDMERGETLLALTFPANFFAPNTSADAVGTPPSIAIKTRFLTQPARVQIRCGPSTKPLKRFKLNGTIKAVVPLLGMGAVKFLDTFAKQLDQLLAKDCPDRLGLNGTGDVSLEVDAIEFFDCSIFWPCTTLGNGQLFGVTLIRKNVGYETMGVGVAKMTFNRSVIWLPSAKCDTNLGNVESIELTDGHVKISRDNATRTGSQIVAFLAQITDMAKNLKHLSLTNATFANQSDVESYKPEGVPTSIPTLRTLKLNRLLLGMDDLRHMIAMPNLEILELKSNALYNLTDIDLGDKYKSLKFLDLSNNSIQTLNLSRIPPGVQVLNISGNNITTVISHRPTSLVTLDVSNNNLSTLGDDQPNFASHFPALENLGLRANKFTEIPESIFGMSGLKRIDLAHNYVQDLRVSTKSDHSSADSVSEIDLSYNRLELVPAHAFKRFKRLEALRIAGNAINRVLPQALHDLNRLAILDLSANRIADLTDLFGFLPNLLYLDLSHNFVPSLRLSEIPGSVRSLNLSANRISEITGSFTGTHEEERTSTAVPNEGLSVLDLSRNLMTRINGSTQFPVTLVDLNLSANFLTAVDDDTLTRLPSLKVLALDSNRLRYLTPRLFTGQGHDSRHNTTLTIYLSGNPFDCDCRMTWLPRAVSGPVDNFVIADADQLMCHHRYYGNTVRVRDAEPDMSPPNGIGTWLCPYTEQCFSLCPCCDFFYCDCKMICPSACDCYRDSSWTTNAIRCDSRTLHRVPENLPRFATSIRLDGNNLTTLSRTIFFAFFELEYLFLNATGLIGPLGPRSLGKLPRLAVLNLSSNAISDLPVDLFYGTGALEILDVSFNSLSYISSQTFEGLRSLKLLNLANNYLRRVDTAFISLIYLLAQPDAPRDSKATNKFEIDLSENPLDCTRCDMITFLATNLSSHALKKRITCLSNGAFLDDLPSDQETKTLTLWQALKTCPNMATEIIDASSLATPEVDLTTFTATMADSSTASSTIAFWWDRFLTVTHTSAYDPDIKNLTEPFLTTISPKADETSSHSTDVELNVINNVEINSTQNDRPLLLKHSKYWELAGIILAIILCIVSIWILCLRCILGTMVCRRNMVKKSPTKKKKNSKPNYEQRSFMSLNCCSDGRHITRSASSFTPSSTPKTPYRNDTSYNSKIPKNSGFFRNFKFSLVNMVPNGRANQKFMYDLFVSYGQGEQSFVQHTLGPRLGKARYKLCLQYPQEMYVTDVIRQTVEKSRRILLLLPCKIYAGIGGTNRNVTTLANPEPFRDVIGIYHDLFASPGDSNYLATSAAKKSYYPDPKKVIVIVVPENSVALLGSAKDILQRCNDTSAVDSLAPLMGHSNLASFSPDDGREEALQKSTTTVSTLSQETEVIKCLTSHPVVYWTDDLFWEKLLFLIGTPIFSRKLKQPITEL